ncbi:MAG: biotin transporter BioY [Clostridia bacterium]|nr:biotin transporter BioY [Clostridia bacterium]
MEKTQKTSAKLIAADIAECALFVALMTAGANISIPFFPVPLTFQTVISVLAGLLLGWRKGAISMAVYCVAGLIGIPVFTNLGGGIAYVLKPTFGYVLGFILSALVAGLLVRKDGLPFWRYMIAAVAAFIVNYAVGLPYFAIVWQFYLNSPDLGKYVVEFNLLYMPKDLALCLLAAVLAWRVLPHIRRGRYKLKQTDNPNKQED